MKWNKFRRLEALKKLAEHSEVVSSDLEKYASPEHRLNPDLQDKTLTMTFDLTLPITPQIEEAANEALWGQRDLGLKLKRATAQLSDEDFEQGLAIVTMHSEGKSFQEIGDHFWPRDQTQGGRKTKAFRIYRQTLTIPSRLKIPTRRLR